MLERGFVRTLDAEANNDAFRGGEEMQASDTDFLNSKAYSFKRYLPLTCRCAGCIMAHCGLYE